MAKTIVITKAYTITILYICTENSVNLQSASVDIKLSKDAFPYYDVNNKSFVKDVGTYNIMLGFSSRDIKLQKNVTIHQ